MGLLFSKARSRWFSQSVLQESFMCGVFESCAGFISVSFYFYFFHFPDSSVGKEPACNAGDPGLISGLRRSTGEGIGYPLQYSWASLVVQLIKNLPAMWETWVQSLGWEDPLEKGTLYSLPYSGLESSMDCVVHRVAKSWTFL